MQGLAKTRQNICRPIAYKLNILQNDGVRNVWRYGECATDDQSWLSKETNWENNSKHKKKQNTLFKQMQLY